MSNLKHAIFVGGKFLDTLSALARESGRSTTEILVRAVAFYRTVKEKERQGYKPAVVKGKKATLLEEGD